MQHNKNVVFSLIVLQLLLLNKICRKVIKFSVTFLEVPSLFLIAQRSMWNIRGVAYVLSQSSGLLRFYVSAIGTYSVRVMSYVFYYACRHQFCRRRWRKPVGCKLIVCIKLNFICIISTRLLFYLSRILLVVIYNL